MNTKELKTTSFKEPDKTAGSESVSYTMSPLEGYLSNGAKAFLITQIIFTKVRATLTTGGYKCYWTFTFKVATFGWYKETTDNFTLELLNHQQGTLEYFNFKVNMGCQLQGNPENMIREADFNPDIYDIIEGARFTTPASIWKHC